MRNRFYRYCIALTRNEADAFYLLQNSLEKFVRRGNRRIEKQGGYFFRMIHNRVLVVSEEGGSWRVRQK